VIQVYRIPIPKASLLKLPKDERVCLLQLGYMANQVLMFEKLLIFATTLDSKNEVEQYTAAVQTQMLVRLAVSAVFESLLVVERLFVKSKIGNDYKDKLDQKGNDSLAYLKTLMGKSALLATVRNNYGFHYPKVDETEEAFQAAIVDADFDGMWKVYFSHHAFNSMFLFCDLISTKGIAAEAGVADLADLQKQLMSELREAAFNLVDFAHSFFAALWVQHFGKKIDADGITEIKDAPKFDEVSIPFFVEV
jgi:hypothetical protein